MGFLDNWDRGDYLRAVIGASREKNFKPGLEHCMLYSGAMAQVILKPAGVPRARLPTRFGEFEIFGFESEGGEQAVAVVKGLLAGGQGQALAGSPSEADPPLVRIHSQCLTGDILHSLRCDCGEQLERALTQIEEAGCGIVIYQMQEGRGIGLLNKIRAYQLQDEGVDTVEANFRLGFEADLRSYAFCAEILKFLGVKRIRLMSNNPRKIEGIEAEGIEVAERVPLVVKASRLSARYLRTKKEKLGHLLD